MTVLQERIGLAVAVVVVLAAVNANSLIALIRPLPEQSYTGIFTNEEDIYSYFTKMRVGSEGQLLLDNRYAVEAHRQVPFYLIYTTFGWFIEKLSPVTPVPFDHLVSSYHGLRVVAGAAYLLVLYRVMVLFFAEPAKRGAAWALAVIGGGLGGITTAATGDILFAGGALDLLIGEFTSLRPLVALPHVLIGRTLLLTGVIALVEAVEARRFPAAAILAWTGMTLTMPLYLAPAGGIVGAWIVVRLIADRRIAWEIVWRGLAAGAPGMLFAGLTLILSAQDPVISAWMEQNQIKPAGLPGLMLAVGVQVAAAVAGWIIVLRRKPERWALLIGWAVVPFVLIWIPYNVSLRLIEAYFVPLAILMVIGLAELIEKQRIAGIAAVVVTVLLMLPSAVFTTAGPALFAALGSEPAYQPADVGAVMAYLRQQAPPESVVLSLETLGVRLPAGAPVRAVVGHGFETPDFTGRQAAAEAFFMGENPGILDEFSVDYVVVGPEERELCAGCSLPPRLEPVYTSGDITVYAVRR